MTGPSPESASSMARTTAMPAASSLHPSAAQLRAFAQGRLSAGDMADVESHVATCDACCRQLENIPDDTLVQLAREAATFSFREDDARTPKSSEQVAARYSARIGRPSPLPRAGNCGHGRHGGRL